MVALNNGNNTVKVIARNGQQIITDEVNWQYQTTPWTAPVKLILEHTGDLVKVKAVDTAGVLCLDAANEIEFSIAGNGRLIDDLGTAGGSRKVQLANGQASIRIAINEGTVIVAAAGKGMETGMTQLKK